MTICQTTSPLGLWTSRHPEAEMRNSWNDFADEMAPANNAFVDSQGHLAVGPGVEH